MNMPVASSSLNMPNPDFWTVARNTAVWWSPIVAGFIGAFGVHLLTQSREREKWILDSKKQEYRELLDALSDSYMSTASVSAGFGNKEDRTPYDSIGMKQNDSIRIFSDRISITNDLPLVELADSWREAMNKYTYTTDGWDISLKAKPNEDFDKEYERIKDRIVAAANRSVPKTTWQRLMFWRQ